MKSNRIYGILGILFVVAGLFMPTGWYNPLPQREALATPAVSGLLLFQISLVIEGLFLIVLAVTRWRFVPLAENQRLPAAKVDDSEAGRERLYLGLLAGITLLALVLRLISLNSELWLDEITPLRDYANASFLQVIISYISSNNHLMNTLLVKLAVGLFGEQAWVVRLPAVLFGTATVPLMYWFSRQLMSRRASLGVALILAVSYHHIFYSQDARGYTAYLFFSILSSALLVKGLREDLGRIWVWFVITSVLNFSVILIAMFVLAAHGLIGLMSLVELRRRSAPVWPMFKRLFGVFLVTGFLAFQLYAIVLPQVLIYMQAVYGNDPSAGYASPFSLDFLQEIVRGVSSGFGAGLLLGAIPFLLMAAIGFAGLVRKNWPLMLALTLPPVIHATFLLVRGLVFSPRFFLLALPVAMLASVEGVQIAAAWIGRLLKRGPTFVFRLSAVLVLMFCVGFAASLRGYYSVPKQSFLTSLEYVESRRTPDDIVIVIHLADAGYHYYGQQFNIQEGKDYFFVRSVDALDSVLAANPGKGVILVTTFPRALRISLPDLADRIEQGWTIVRTFPATIGDGEISVWEQNNPVASQG